MSETLTIEPDPIFKGSWNVVDSRIGVVSRQPTKVLAEAALADLRGTLDAMRRLPIFDGKGEA